MTKYIFALFSLLNLLSCQQNIERDDEQIVSAIYGGTPSSNKEFSAVVAIGKKHCTGTLISPNIVVTAAHCIVEGEYSDYRIKNIEHKVIVGNDYNSFFSRKYTIDYGVVHPLYNFNQSNYDHYDIAFLKLKRKVRGVNYIEVATYQEIEKLSGHEITFVGFGMNDLDNADGKQLFVTSKVNRLGKTELFAGGHGSSICFGDSGGPILAKLDGKLKLVGVTSRNYSSFLGPAALACKDESIFTKASVIHSLIESENLIDDYIKNSNPSFLYQSQEKYPDESWASYYLAQNSKHHAEKLIMSMPWLQHDQLTSEENLLQSAIAYLKHGATQEALKHFEQLENLTPQVKSYYAQALKRHARYEEALELIYDSDSELDLELKFEIYLTRQNIEQAQELYPQIKLTDSNFALHIYYQIVTGNEEAAIDLVKAAPKYALNRLFSRFGNILQIAISWNQLNLANELIDYGIDVNAKANYGSAINAISGKNNLPLLRKIIANGSNIDTPDGQYGNTALIIAATSGYLDIVKILIENGANPKHQGAYGVTALSMAQQKGHQEIIDYLESLP